jgi:threonine/homoserine/homoserine lactone efflux protein
VTGTPLLTGAIVGFSIAAPVGPIGALTIRRTLAHGRLAGFITGLGAATADSLYGALAAFGLTMITAYLVAQQRWLSISGGLFLCYLGVRTFLARPAVPGQEADAAGLLAAYASTVFLTLTNPATILSFIGIYAGLGLAGGSADYADAAAFVAGVFSGSASWWLLLSVGIGALRENMSVRELRWINRMSGAVIAAFGVAAVIMST